MSDAGQAIIAAMRQAAAEDPDHIEQECKYVVLHPVTDQPCAGCLVGQGLWRCGFINGDYLRDNDNDLKIGAYNATVGIWAANKVLHALSIDQSEWSWIGAAQDAQDRQKPWSEAIAYADNQVPAKAE